MTATVLDFLERARRASEAAAERVEIEARSEAYRDECEARRQRVAHVPMPDAVRQRVIAGRLDTEGFLCLRRCRTWWGHNAPALLMGGTTGRGKSVACIDAIASHGGVFIEAGDLARVWQAKYGPDVATRVSLFGARCLAIDDVGSELAADRAVISAALVTLLNKRASSRTKTIITFNGDAAQFRKMYADERLHSRIAQLGVWLVDVGPDLRRVVGVTR